MGVAEILEFIATCPKLKIDAPKRSGKVTIMIPISNGSLIGSVAQKPKFTVVDRVTPNGRHDIFARPSGGRIDVKGDALLALLS